MTGKCTGRGNTPGWVPSSGYETQAIPTATIDRHAKSRIVRGPEYHNPDPIARLISLSNKSCIKIEGQEVQALLDTGANMSCITKWLVTDLGLTVHSLDAFRILRELGEGKYPIMGM